MSDYKNLIIGILLTILIYSFYSHYNKNEEIDSIKLRYDKGLEDSINAIHASYQLQLDGLKVEIDSLTRLDSTLIDSLEKSKIEDNEIYHSIMGQGADSAYNIIIRSIHSDSTDR